MHLSLIGMSNSGKSYLSKKLKEHDFTILCCDDIIAQRLDLVGVGDVASWMGQPYEPRHKERSAQYQQLESAVMHEILNQISVTSPDKNVVVDTTGSVIYTGDDILRELVKKTTVIFLDTPPHVKDEMYHSYIREPKPVIWGDQFSPRKSESPLDTLARCYPQLLEYRINKYKQLAHITLDYFWLRHPKWTADDLLQRLL